MKQQNGTAQLAPQAKNGLKEVLRLLLQSFEEQGSKQNRNRDPAQLPEFWKLVKTTKATEDHRMNLYQKMAEWSKKMGIDINRGIFFPKDSIDDIVKLRFNPMGISATLTTCDKSISNLLCLPRTAGKIEALKLFKQEPQGL